MKQDANGKAARNPDTKGAETADRQEALVISTSRHFKAWLMEQRASLAFTTYQAGKLFLIGIKPDGELSIVERTFERCMGLFASRQTLWMTSLYQLWRFENVLEAQQEYNGFDRLYVPQMSYVTGDLDVHDVGLDDA